MIFLEKLLRSKVVIWILLILPGLWPAWPLLRHDPSATADPGTFVMRHMGTTACVLLAAVLALTPLRVLFPKFKPGLALNRHRRLIGVSSFAYGVLHLAFYILNRGWHTLVHDAWDKPKPFILAGLTIFTILLVLSVTSLHVFIRWLGGRRWKRLHRLAYVAAILAIYHQAAASKLFPVQIWWIFVPLGLLEIGRIVKQARGTRAAPAALAKAEAAK